MGGKMLTHRIAGYAVKLTSYVNYVFDVCCYSGARGDSSMCTESFPKGKTNLFPIGVLATEGFEANSA